MVIVWDDVWGEARPDPPLTLYRPSADPQLMHRIQPHRPTLQLVVLSTTHNAAATTQANLLREEHHKEDAGLKAKIAALSDDIDPAQAAHFLFYFLTRSLETRRETKYVCVCFES